MNAGLCERCRFVKRLESSRGSVFYMCTLAERDAAFARYPRLPVLACKGFQAQENAGGASFSKNDEKPHAP